ncbi:MAG: DegT/DnrJ/EryC1/StrS family aminotransferase [Cyclobacteriaceae bacterium]|nr:DegT/DnrJ/EryC1/StrS family aminotransferase [Cyclobacteriaceae bacterium]
MKIPFVNLTAQYESIKKDIDKAIENVITETAFIGGKYVNNFEKEFADAYGCKNVVACANGTDSLYIIMKMLGIKEGDEVITVANSWISSSETITQTGAKPVFIDIHPEYYSMDESLLISKITSKTKAVIAVHLQGQACDIETIKNICDERNIHLIEDCAQSHFSEYKGKRVGLYGIASSFSFYPGKNLGAYGDAGCITSNDDAFAEKCKMFARHGALKKHHHQMEGINSRMDGLQAAILSAKLPHIIDWTNKRIANAAIYNKCLNGISQIKIPTVRPESKHTFHLYVIVAEKRDELMKHLADGGIETFIHYPSILPNLQAYKYLGHTPSDFPVASDLQPKILSLPMYPELSEKEIQNVSNSIRAFYGK